jgi:hypothetical protein
MPQMQLPTIVFALNTFVLSLFLTFVIITSLFTNEEKLANIQVELTY